MKGMTTHRILRASPKLKNLGPVSAAWVASVGISTRADLIRLGAVATYLRVRDAGHKPSLNLLWALAGAERGLRWNLLPDEDRQRLLIELDAADSARKTPVAPAKVEAPLRRARTFGAPKPAGRGKKAK